MNIMIKADRIRILREAAKPKKLSQDGLAKLARIGKRQIQRIEQNDGDLQIRQNTLERLAKALRVDPRVITGEHPLPNHASLADHGSSLSSTTTVRLTAMLQLQFDLVEEIYGAKFQDLMQLAPTLFVLIAEQSLAWRVKMLESKGQRLEEFALLRGKGESGDKFFECAEELWGDLSQEAQSIASNDVFGDCIESQDPWGPNPFALFLQQELSSKNLRGKLDCDSGAVEHGAWTYFEGHHVPILEVCDNHLNYLAGYTPEAIQALRTGVVSIKSIPQELRDRSKTVDRVQWIIERANSSSNKGGEA